MAKKKTPSQSMNTLRTEFKAQNFKPVYLLEGASSEKLTGILDFLVDKVLGQSGAAFNYHRYDGDSQGAELVIRQASAIPMMCERQIIWLKNAENSVTSIDVENALINYFDNPESSSIVLLTANKFDGRKKWVKRAKSINSYYDINPPKGALLVTETISEAKKMGFTLTKDLAELVVELSNEDQVAIHTELSKLAIMADDKGVTSAEKIEEILLDQRSIDVFSFVSAIGPGKLSDGLDMYNKYLAEGRSVYEIAPLLIWRIKQVAMVSSLLSEGYSQSEIPSRAGISPYACKQVVNIVNQWGDSVVQVALEACRQCESDLKGSPLSPEVVLERAILSICNS